MSGSEQINHGLFQQGRCHDLLMVGHKQYNREGRLDLAVGVARRNQAGGWGVSSSTSRPRDLAVQRKEGRARGEDAAEFDGVIADGARVPREDDRAAGPEDGDPSRLEGEAEGRCVDQRRVRPVGGRNDVVGGSILGHRNGGCRLRSRVDQIKYALPLL